MSFHIKKSFILDSSKNMYYTGGIHWSEDYSKRKNYSTESEADTVLVTGGGEHTEQFRNSIVSSDT